MVERVTDRLRQCRTAGDPIELPGQPDLHGLDQRAAALLALRSAVLGGRAADLGLDRVERGDPLQRLFGETKRPGADFVAAWMS